MNEGKKAFDRTVCFSFYGSWVKAIEQLETAEDKDSLAYTLYKAIANYNLYGEEPNFDGIETYKRMALKAAWEIISNEADNSIKRRKRGFAQEQPTEIQRAIIQEAIARPDASVSNIANVLATGKGHVSNTLRRYAGLIEKGRAEREDCKVVLESDDQREPKTVEQYIEEDNGLPF